MIVTFQESLPDDDKPTRTLRLILWSVLLLLAVALGMTGVLILTMPIAG